MLSRSLAAVFTLSCLLAALPVSVHAQSGGEAAPAQQPGYTFHTSTRIVLTDVTVTDAKGNPVHGLKASAFHIFDNNKPQILASFGEHTTTPVASLPQSPATPGVYSNKSLLHLPPVLNIIVIDTTNIAITDQMYLNYELTRFLDHLPPDQPLAIYWRTGPASVLLQSFTSDQALLLAAVHKALPHFRPLGREYYSDFATLYKIAFDFGQFPGRKNILWFSGGSTLYLRPDASSFQDQDDWRYIYDQLESGRIAIYPVDARGLTMTEGFNMWAQHALMNNIADATGGRAFYNNNGLDKTTARWLDNSGSFYTLTYSPQNFRMDNKWHKVKVTLDTDGPTYYLSYRRGYFADGSNGIAQQPMRRRTRLLADGETVREPDLRSVPIIFQARVLPVSEAPPDPSEIAIAKPAAQAKPKRGTIPLSIQYSLPADAFATKTVDGKQQIELGVAVIAFNEEGSTIAQLADQVIITVNPDKLRLAPKTLLPVDQQINLHKGEDYLYFAVWDMTSGRLGTLQTPLKVAAPR